MAKNIKALSLSSILCALSVIFLYISSVIPSGKIAMVAIAGVLPSICVIKSGLAYGFIIYGITFLLSFLLVPDKGNVFLYLFIFGHYPMVKSLIEGLDRLIVEWILKLAIFNVLLIAYYFLFKSIFLNRLSFNVEGLFVPLALIILNIVFVIYDIGFTKIIFFMKRYIK